MSTVYDVPADLLINHIAEELKNFKKVFINAKILEEKGEEWKGEGLKKDSLLHGAFSRYR